MRVVHSTHCPDLGPICAVRDEPPQLHDQKFYVSELRPTAELQLTDWAGVELQLPLRLSATTVVYRRLDGTLYEPDYVNIHHRNETLAGIGDPWVSGRASWTLGEFGFGARLGFTLPLGRTEENPFALGAAGLEHQHVQFGTGTVTPLLGLDVNRTFGDVALRAWGQAQLSLYENRHGYLAGHRLASGVEGGTTLLEKLRASATFDVFHEAPERWDGVVQQDGNLGRTDLLVGATVGYAFGEVQAVASVKVPVYQHIVRSPGHDGGQLTYPAIVSLWLQRTFDLAR